MLTLLFFLKPVPKGQIYQKQKGPGTSDQSLFRLRSKFRKIITKQNMFRKIFLLVMYYLAKFNDVM